MNVLWRCIVVAVMAVPVAGDAEVRVAARAGAEECLSRGAILATTDGHVPVRVTLRAGESSYRLPLASEFTWDVRVDSEGCWSETVSWSNADPGSLSLEVHKSATVRGAFEGLAEDPPLLEGALFFRRNGGRAIHPGRPALRTNCTVAFPRWSCSVPADIAVDLRLDIRGFASVHYWGVVARARESHLLEPRRLHPGGSVTGWVETARGEPIARAKVTLYPLTADAPSEDPGRAALRARSAFSSDRGFFQITGLEPGVYRLVSEAPGLSAATIPELRVRDEEPTAWPRPITHVAPASLEVTLSPPLDSNGKPWKLELEEKSPLPLNRKPAVRGNANKDGKWLVDRLRADSHRLTVQNSAGSDLEVLDVDLSEGGTKLLSVEVRHISVRGVLRSRGEPIAAGIQFENFSGRVVHAETGEDGHFEAVFPSAGSWVPTVRYPRSGASSRIALKAIEVAADGHELEIDVPGGRIHGRVITSESFPERTAVYVIRDGKPAAQVLIDGDGEFTFIGLESGSYSLAAASSRAATARPVDVSLDENSSLEVELVLEPYALVSGVVVTPRGTPASGAVVRFSFDEGRSWSTRVADARGEFEVRSPSDVQAVELVVLTYAYPASVARVPRERRSIVLRLQEHGGLLRIKNGAIPYVRQHAFGAPLRAFHYPEPFGRFEGGAYLEAGPYVVCPDRQIDSSCRDVVVAPGAEVLVEFPSSRQTETATP